MTHVAEAVTITRAKVLLHTGIALVVTGAIVLASGGDVYEYAKGLALSAVPALNKKEVSLPQRQAYAKGRFIVKFKSSGEDALNICTSCEAGKIYTRKTTSSVPPRVHDLNEQYKVGAMTSLFFPEKETTEYAQFKQQDMLRTRGGVLSVPDLSNIFVLEVPESTNIEEIVNAYAVSAEVEYAQPDYLLSVTNDTESAVVQKSNDPRYNELWGMQKISAEQAWSVTQGEGVTVAVVDTGVDYRHEDLKNNIWTNPGEDINNNGVVDAPDFNGVDDDNNGYVDDIRGWDFTTCQQYYVDGRICSKTKSQDNNPFDGRGHGTHVSGTIAAERNIIGVVGVAPKAKIMAVKGLDDQGNGASSELAAGIVYAATNGADVINNSWGCTLCITNPIVEDAVRVAHALGVITVFSAGNDNLHVSYYSPQNLEEVIAVGATDPNDKKSEFSNYGELIYISAPGRDILSTIPGNRYGAYSGTSMAAPHVSGVIALVRAKYPNLDYDGVKHRLASSADVIDTGKGGMAGRLNAHRAVTESLPSLLADIEDPVGNALIHKSDTRMTVRGTAGGSQFKDYTLSYKSIGNLKKVFTQDAYRDHEWKTLVTSTAQVRDGVLGEVDIAKLPKRQIYILRLLVTTTNGDEAQSQSQFILLQGVPNTTTNTPPVIKWIKPAGFGYYIVWEATDKEDRDPIFPNITSGLVYYYRIDGGEWEETTLPYMLHPNYSSVPMLQKGKHKLEIYAVDSEGLPSVTKIYQWIVPEITFRVYDFKYKTGFKNSVFESDRTFYSYFTWKCDMPSDSLYDTSCDWKANYYYRLDKQGDWKPATYIAVVDARMFPINYELRGLSPGRHYLEIKGVADGDVARETAVVGSYFNHKPLDAVVIEKLMYWPDWEHALFPYSTRLYDNSFKRISFFYRINNGEWQAFSSADGLILRIDRIGLEKEKKYYIEYKGVYDNGAKETNIVGRYVTTPK